MTEEARKDWATTLAVAENGFIEGLKAACEVFGKAQNTIKFEVLYEKDNENE